MEANREIGLKEAGEFLQAFVWAAPDAIVHIDGEGRIMFWNRAAEQLFGYSSAEIRGKDLHLLLAAPEYHNACSSGIKMFAETGKGPVIGNIFESVAVKKDKTRLQVEISTTAVKIDGKWHAIAMVRDISQRKAIEQNLRESNMLLMGEIKKRDETEEFLRESQRFVQSIADLSPNVHYIYDLAGHQVVYSNREMLKIMGYDPAQIKKFDNWALLKLIHPDDLPALSRIKERFLTLKDGEILEVEYRMKDSLGQWRWLMSRDTVFTRNPDGSPCQILGAAVDVTAQKSVEKALIEREERFRKVFEEGPIGMAISSLDGRYIKVNPALSRMLGFTEEEFVSMGVNDVTHPDDRRPNADLRGLLFKGELPFFQMEKRFIRKDGSLMWGNLTVSLVRDEKGAPLYYIGMVEDIEARKQAEEDKALLAAAVESTADAMTVTGLDGKIQYVNESFENITGITKKEALGTNIKDMDRKNPGPDYFHFGKAFDDTIRTGSPWTGRFSMTGKNGVLLQLEETIAPVRDRSGKVTNVVVIDRDITEKLRLESIAEAVNTMDNIGYVFSGIRHEIGNPVSSIKMALSVLKNKLEGGCNRQVVDTYLDRAISELARMEYLLKMLKSFNVHESPELKDINTVSFTNNFKSLVSEDFKNKGISVGVYVQPEARYCRADPRALQQVMLNIMTNAADALKDRPAPRIDIKILKMAGNILIHIEDNGCGMTPDQLKDAFRPFYTTKPEGTGLGLMLARKMITRMNGTVEISSELGVGTAVDIFIPEGTHGK